MKEVFSESGTGVGRIMLCVEDEMYGSSKIIVEHSNNSAILKILLRFLCYALNFEQRNLNRFTTVKNILRYFTSFYEMHPGYMENIVTIRR